MRLMCRAPCFAFALLLAAVLPTRPAMANDDAAAFMTNVANRVISIIDDRRGPEAARRQEFRTVVDQAFDLPSIARWVLGDFWRTATLAERRQYSTAFGNYMLQVYWSRFSTHRDESFEVLGQQYQADGNVRVRSELLRPGSGRAPVKVSWWLERRGDTFKILDASVEGVSQAETCRDEFADIIERSGGRVSALIARLNARAHGT